MKTIPKKNYLILGLILVVSVFLVFYINNFLNSTLNTCKEQSIMSQLLNEITTNDIDNFILENPNTIIYMSNKNTCENSKFEKKFKQFLLDEELVNDFVFINLSEIDNKTYVEFIEKYYDGKNIPTMNNSIIIVEQKKIKDILNSGNLEIKEVKKFLKDNGVY